MIGQHETASNNRTSAASKAAHGEMFAAPCPSYKMSPEKIPTWTSLVRSRPYRDWIGIVFVGPTQHCVLGYSQPSLSGLVSYEQADTR
jgi:hypothetical protein